MWEYENCASLKPQIDVIGKDNSLTEEQKNAAIGKLLSAPKACVLGVRHPPTGIEFGLGCSMCEDSQSSSEKLKENEAAVKAKLATVKAELMKAPRVLRYHSDFDEHGVMWYLGTCGKTQPYVNPAESGFVKSDTQPPLTRNTTVPADLYRRAQSAADSPSSSIRWLLCLLL